MQNLRMALSITFFISSCQNIDLGQINSSVSDAPPNTLSSEEWVRIPANTGGMGLETFYVMKYEAKAYLESNGTIDTSGTSIDVTTHRPVSTRDYLPWREINPVDAANECESLGTGYRLISNTEWMAIARDIENQNANWTGGSVGAGCLFKGNSGESTCGYDGADPEEGASRNARSRFMLSNGEEIYDFAGNVNEWIDWDDSTTGFQLGPVTCPNAGWEEFPSVSCGALSPADYSPASSSFNNTNEGVGQFFGGTGGATMRGGSSGSTDRTGVYTLLFFFDNTYTSSFGGFRCVYRKP